MKETKLASKIFNKHSNCYIPYKSQLGKIYLIVNPYDENESAVMEAGDDDNYKRTNGIPYSFRCLMSSWGIFKVDKKFHWLIIYDNVKVTEL